TARIGGRRIRGKARLETVALEFRAPGVRLSLPFAQLTTVEARAGSLAIEAPEGSFSFALGEAATKWADKILYPPSRLAKIGVKPAWRAGGHGPAVVDCSRRAGGRGVRPLG